MELRFVNPILLLLLLIVPAMVAIYFYRSTKGQPAIAFSDLHPVKIASTGSLKWPPHILLGLRTLVVCCAVIALARPQSGLKEVEVKTEGIDILLVMDVSSSMLAEDIEPNRLEAANAVASKFVEGRINDRIGLVVFSGKAYTQCPLTLDYGILLNLFQEIKVGMIEDGTAIGMGLGVAVNRLKESDAKSKVIVLLTDGRNNRGEIDAGTAAQLAQTFGIKIYTIGAGAQGAAPYPIDDPLFGRRYVQVKVDIDEEMLQKIAQITKGHYYRATDRDSLESIYREIDKLEKTELDMTEFTLYAELFHFPLGLGVLLLVLEFLLSNTRFRKIP